MQETPTQLLIKYFAENSVEVDILKRHEVVRKLFVKYNTAVPSSTPCVSLFSTARKTLHYSRVYLKDNHFEGQLLLKRNSFNKKRCNVTI